MVYVAEGVLRGCWWDDEVDPGPVPAVVEPEVPRSTTVVVSPYAQVVVTEDVAGSGLTGLTVTCGGASVTVPLPAPCAEAVYEALLGATPAPYLPAAGVGPVEAGGGRA